MTWNESRQIIAVTTRTLYRYQISYTCAYTLCFPTLSSSKSNCAASTILTANNVMEASNLAAPLSSRVVSARSRAPVSIPASLVVTEKFLLDESRRSVQDTASCLYKTRILCRACGGHESGEIHCDACDDEGFHVLVLRWGSACHASNVSMPIAIDYDKPDLGS